MRLFEWAKETKISLLLRRCWRSQWDSPISYAAASRCRRCCSPSRTARCCRSSSGTGATATTTNRRRRTNVPRTWPRESSPRACSASTCSHSRRRPRCGTRASTSRRPTRSDYRIRRAIRCSCIVGRAFSVLPIAATVAARINILAAISSAAAAGWWFLVTEHVLRAWLRVARAANRRRDGRGGDRRRRVHRVEPVGGEREGLHRLARRHRARVVARRAMDA